MLFGSGLSGLGKEGLTTYTRAYGSPGSRLDVSTDFLPQDRLRQPGVKYFMADNEEYLLKEPGFYKEAKEIFGMNKVRKDRDRDREIFRGIFLNHGKSS